MSDLLYGEVENDLRASVRDLLTDRSPWTSVLARVETDKPYDLELWRTLAAEMGLAGLLVPEDLGGAGASAREVAVVLEELGRAVTPTPFLGSAVLATTALLAAGDTETVAELAAGQRIGALAVSLTTAPNAAFPSAVKVVDGKLTGRVGSVADLEVADVVVVPAIGADGPELHVVQTASAGVTVTPITPLDLTRRIATLELDGVESRKLDGDAAAALRTALTTGAGPEAAEQVGVADDHPARTSGLDIPAEQEQQPIEAEAADATAKAFAAEHERQLQQQRDNEIAAAGEPTNIGTDGKAHFEKLVPKDGVDVSDGDHDPADFEDVCGGCGEPWPCEQAQELERRAAGQRGEQPPAASQQ